MTALAVTADDTRAFSVSKDGSIIQMDIESGTRCANWSTKPENIVVQHTEGKGLFGTARAQP